MFRLRTIIALWLARKAWQVVRYWWRRRTVAGRAGAKAPPALR